MRPQVQDMMLLVTLERIFPHTITPPLYCSHILSFVLDKFTRPWSSLYVVKGLSYGDEDVQVWAKDAGIKLDRKHLGFDLGSACQNSKESKNQEAAVDNISQGQRLT